MAVCRSTCFTIVTACLLYVTFTVTTSTAYVIHRPHKRHTGDFNTSPPIINAGEHVHNLLPNHIRNPFEEQISASNTKAENSGFIPSTAFRSIPNQLDMWQCFGGINNIQIPDYAHILQQPSAESNMIHYPAMGAQPFQQPFQWIPPQVQRDPIWTVPNFQCLQYRSPIKRLLCRVKNQANRFHHNRKPLRDKTY